MRANGVDGAQLSEDRFGADRPGGAGTQVAAAEGARDPRQPRTVGGENVPRLKRLLSGGQPKPPDFFLHETILTFGS